MKNLTWTNSLLAVAAALILAGCSSTPTRVDTGAIKASSFSFVNGGVPAKAEFADNREQAHAMIQKALTDYLTAKGLTKVTTGGDVTVAYLVVLGNNVSTESINTYFGYGRDAWELQDKAHKAYTGKETPNYFEAGTLLVDILDSKSGKLLQRHYATRPVLRNASDATREANIREAVFEVLKDLNVVK
jgi:hypothetical protein